MDVFATGEVADDFGVDPGDGLEFSGPVLGVVGPGDPGGGVEGPLGWHAVVAGYVRCFVLCSCHRLARPFLWHGSMGYPPSPILKYLKYSKQKT